MSNHILEKISVIVPCYKVAAYVEKCLLSVINQTYSNLEILAIDDGSPDDTPAILDRLAKQYSQLKVIHKKNGGVSLARNTGLSHATGDYIVFVDGDDFLAPDYMEYMLDLVHKTGAEFCLSLDCFKKQRESQTVCQSIKTVSPADAVALLLSPRVVVGCWNKIYKRNLLIKHNCIFATDLFYGEGLNFIITVAQWANCVGIGNRKAYYYRRNNVLSATTQFNIKTLESNNKSLNRIERNLKFHTPLINTMLILHRSLFYLSTAVRIRTAGQLTVYRSEYQQCMSYVRKNYLKLLFNPKVSIYRKCMLLVGCINPWFLVKLDVIRRKRIVAQSVGA